jgi:NAD(P)-dependent dehydrogenase (short-subunit alcohol dehydrogenase family)
VRRNTNRSILITGCSTGIGRTCAKGMRARGWRVFATARTDTDLESLKGDGVEPIFLDYTDEASILHCAETVLEQTDGNLSALFNNGAYAQLGALEDIPTDILRQQFEANVFGWHTLTNAIVPAMRAQGFGRIVNCSSVLGFVSLRYRGPYTASKHVIEAMSETLQLELQGSGVDVSIIAPGPIATKFTETAVRMFRTHIDMDDSAHTRGYRRRMQQLEDGKSQIPFKLGPEAVLSKLIDACESRRPKLRYMVTVPTYALAAAKRVLPTPVYRGLRDRISESS